MDDVDAAAPHLVSRLSNLFFELKDSGTQQSYFWLWDIPLSWEHAHFWLSVDDVCLNPRVTVFVIWEWQRDSSSILFTNAMAMLFQRNLGYYYIWDDVFVACFVKVSDICRMCVAWIWVVLGSRRMRRVPEHAILHSYVLCLNRWTREECMLPDYVLNRWTRE